MANNYLVLLQYLDNSNSDNPDASDPFATMGDGGGGISNLGWFLIIFGAWWVGQGEDFSGNCANAWTTAMSSSKRIIGAP